ncbi:MAG TPA: hypothetical protein VEL05_03055, partial [Candidatus Acidoferrum sp.]|nr:hypothetical protein [Candidatus Acidoferrum sp.]
SLHRLVTSAALAAALLASAPASAQTPAVQADRRNQEGKQLFADKDYDGAYRKFREAATLSPEGRYFFNMCYALNFLERYQEAIEACEQVEPAGADAELIDKTRKALASLKEKAAGQGGESGGTAGAAGGTGGTGATGGEAGGTTGGGTGDTGGRTGGAGRRTGGGGEGSPPGPPPRGRGGADPFISGAAGPGDYTWSIGAAIGGLGNINTGRKVDNEFGSDQEVYAAGGVDLHLFANFIVSEAARFGVQTFLGIGAFAAGQDPPLEDQNLVIYDFGAAAFVHVPLGKRLFLTPLAGAQLSVQWPQELSQGFFAAGVRGELGLSYVFGPKGTHAFSVTPAVNLYFPASGEVDGEQPDLYGLDLTHATFGILLGYTFRFSTPFGSIPIINLE